MHLEKKIKIASLHYKILKPHVNSFYGVSKPGRIFTVVA
jgi:hypothetical protein